MPIVTVTMAHPDGEGWNEHPQPHLDHILKILLLKILEAGQLKTSGPLKSTRLHSGFLIIAAADRAGVQAIVAADPFFVEGPIVDPVVTGWDPVCGAFHDISSRQMPGGLGTAG